MSAHSTLIGGSSAERLLNCHGSYQLIQRLPVQEESSSEFALYGTAMHAVMDRLLEFYSDGLPADHEPMMDTAFELLGEVFCDRELTEQHLDESIYPAIDALYAIMNEYGGGFRSVGTELRVRFPNVPGAFGTTDLLLASASHVLLIDYKFGAGVPVAATYTMSDGEIVNAQLLYYLTAAMHTFPQWFKKKRKLAVAVIQPRVDVKFSHTEVHPDEIKHFAQDVEAAVEKAIGRDPQLNRGSWCRWCSAKPACPKWVGPIKELAVFADVRDVPGEVTTPNEFGNFLGDALNLAELARDYIKALEKSAHNWLAAGNEIPGWHLELKQKKLRQWVDSDEVAPKLRALGFAEDDIWVRKLQTFGHTDKVAKKLGVKIPEDLRYTPAGTEIQLARGPGDHVKLDRITALQMLEASVAQLNSRKG
jgi:hypothetical protein